MPSNTSKLEWIKNLYYISCTYILYKFTDTSYSNSRHTHQGMVGIVRGKGKSCIYTAYTTDHSKTIKDMNVFPIYINNTICPIKKSWSVQEIE